MPDQDGPPVEEARHSTQGRLVVCSLALGQHVCLASMLSLNWLRVLSDEKPLKSLAAREGKINSLNLVSGYWTGADVVAGSLANTGIIA